jgi:cell division transport system permease protein
VIRNYLLRHAQVFFYSLGQLFHAPVASLMTVTVIAISLVLPTGLFVLLDNLQGLSGSLDDSVRVTVFLHKNLGQQKTERLLSRLNKRPGIERVEYLSPKQALKDFKKLSGFGEVIDQLEENPLPGVMLVIPKKENQSVSELENLTQQLSAMEEVEFAQLDSAWVERLRLLLELGKRGVIILATLLAVGVMLIVGNTIRLAVLNRRREIEIIKLVGGTDAFVRRPFLYTGTLQGALGALVAIGLVFAVLTALSGPVNQLSSAYGSQITLKGLGAQGAAVLLLTGALLGWLGARIAVSRHLSDIEPE